MVKPVRFRKIRTLQPLEFQLDSIAALNLFIHNLCKLGISPAGDFPHQIQFTNSRCTRLISQHNS